jgi:hypothetical protein
MGNFHSGNHHKKRINKMGATSLLVASSLANGISALSSADAQAASQKMQGEFQKTQSQMNSRLAEIQADDAITRGKTQAEQLGTQTKKMIGAQKAAYAGQGIEIDSGSAMDVQGDTAAMSALDRMTIKNNAAREAWGYKVQANNFNLQGQFAGIAGNASSNMTLLGGGMRALSGGLQGAYYYSSARPSDPSSSGVK